MKSHHTKITRKPAARRPAIILIIINLVAIFFFVGNWKGLTFVQVPAYISNQLEKFFTKVNEEARRFDYGITGDQDVPFGIWDALKIAAIIIVVVLGISRIAKGEGKDLLFEVSDYFLPHILEKKYSSAGGSYFGKITVEDDEIKAYDRRLRFLCRKMRIEEIVFKYGKGQDLFAVEESGFVSIVVIGEKFLHRIYSIPDETMREEFFEFAVCPELSHVRHHDPMNLKWTFILMATIWIDGLVFLAVYRIFLPSHWIIHIIIALAWIFVLSVYVTAGFWSQCREFRADKEAVKASGGNVKRIYKTFRESYHDRTFDVTDAATCL